MAHGWQSRLGRWPVDLFEPIGGCLHPLGRRSSTRCWALRTFTYGIIREGRIVPRAASEEPTRASSRPPGLLGPKGGRPLGATLRPSRSKCARSVYSTRSTKFKLRHYPRFRVVCPRVCQSRPQKTKKDGLANSSWSPILRHQRRSGWKALQSC